ncbi:hypothetical protein ACG7TL_005074 [Trametes sanguinea]
MVSEVPMGTPGNASSVWLSGESMTPPLVSQDMISSSTSLTSSSVLGPAFRSSRRMPFRLSEKRPALAELGSVLGRFTGGIGLFRER